MVVKLISYIKGRHRLRIFENSILRQIFGVKRNENGEWRRLHNLELHNLYHLHNVVRVIKYRSRWAGHVARKEGGTSALKILTDKPTENRPLGMTRRRWEENITMELKQIVVNTRNWVDLTHRGF